MLGGRFTVLCYKNQSLSLGFLFHFQERFDIVESLLEFPFLPLQTDSFRKSSPGSLEPSSAPALQTGASRQRHFSLGGVPQSPSTSGQSEALSAPRSSNEATRRRSSQSRRSSIAASLAGPGETKKGALGLGTLAASLVKWKINNVRKVIRTQETIAKVNFYVEVTRSSLNLVK